jgi:UDP-3-O-[3-hydroxymyristoyl] glucosamine N-acyltransferase
MAKYFSSAVQSEYPMSAFVERHAGHFGIDHVFRAEMTGDLRRTGFTWSETPHTLCLATNRKYILQALSNSNISGLIAHSRFGDELSACEDKLVICCDEPAELFYAVHNLAIHRSFSKSVKTESLIANSVQISTTAVIHDGVSIAEDVVIHDGVIILPGTAIGEGSEIHAGVTLGTQGFFSKPVFGKKTHIDHFGGLSIGSNCIIHARTNISRSVNHDERTQVADNVHMGIGVNVGHDCRVGQDADISTRVVLAGRVNVGQRCWIGAGALISNALTIGDDAEVKIGAVVVSDVAPADVVSGNFAINHKQHLKEYLSRCK